MPHKKNNRKKIQAAKRANLPKPSRQKMYQSTVRHDPEIGSIAIAAAALKISSRLSGRMTDLPKGKWCECGMPHENGGPCWECRRQSQLEFY